MLEYFLLMTLSLGRSDKSGEEGKRWHDAKRALLNRGPLSACLWVDSTWFSPYDLPVASSSFCFPSSTFL